VTLLEVEYIAARLSELAFLHFHTLAHMYVVHDHYQLVTVDISYRENSEQNCLSDWVINRSSSLWNDSNKKEMEKEGTAIKHLGPFVDIYAAGCNLTKPCIQLTVF
jgi:hypothetical protein